MDIEKTIRALTGRGFAVQHFATGREAADYLDGAIDGTTVGIGGSKTRGCNALLVLWGQMMDMAKVEVVLIDEPLGL